MQLGPGHDSPVDLPHSRPRYGSFSYSRPNYELFLEATMGRQCCSIRTYRGQIMRYLARIWKIHVVGRKVQFASATHSELRSAEAAAPGLATAKMLTAEILR